MPIPFLLGGAAVLATVIGASSHKDANETNEKAERVSRKARNLYDDSKESLEDAKDEAEKKLLKLGYTKKNVLDGPMKQFVQTYDRIKNIQLKESSGLNEISKFSIEQQDVVQVKQMSDIYSGSIQSGTAGAATGAVIALAASGSLPMVTGALSLAGTCLSLGSVGAAASIAGTAISTAFTATPLAAFVAPAVFFTGVSASMKADENLEKAEEMYAEAEKASEEMKISETLCTAIGERSEMFNDLLVKLNGMFSDSTDMLSNVIREKDKLLGDKEIKVEDLTEEELELVAVTRALAGAVKAVIDVPILTKDGAVSKESLNVYDNTKKSLPQFSETVLEVKKIRGEDIGSQEESISVETQRSIEINTEDTIESLCKDFIRIQSKSEFCVKESKEVEIFDPNVDHCIFLVHDDISSEHGWNGFVITDKEIYCRKPSVNKINCIPFSKLSKVEQIYIRGKSIYADKETIGFYSGEEDVKEEIRDLFEKIVLVTKKNCDVCFEKYIVGNTCNSTDPAVIKGLLTVDQVRENMNEACQHYQISDWSGKENLFTLILALLHSAELVNDRIIKNFIFISQSREILDSISVWISSGHQNELIEKIILKLSSDECIKMCDVIEWEMQYIRTSCPDKNKILMKMNAIICELKSTK